MSIVASYPNKIPRVGRSLHLSGTKKAAEKTHTVATSKRSKALPALQESGMSNLLTPTI